MASVFPVAAVKNAHRPLWLWFDPSRHKLTRLYFPCDLLSSNVEYKKLECCKNNHSSWKSERHYLKLLYWVWVSCNSDSINIVVDISGEPTGRKRCSNHWDACSLERIVKEHWLGNFGKLHKDWGWCVTASRVTMHKRLQERSCKGWIHNIQPLLYQRHLPGDFWELHASICWQTSRRCQFYFSAGVNSCPQC